jgi:hypothetical protein
MRWPAGSRRSRGACASVDLLFPSMRTWGTALLICASCLFAPAPAALAAPLNDDFADAIVLEGDSDEISGHNFGATKEGGEPAHGGDPGGASVWYRWTAPRSGLVVVQACDTEFETTLSVYSGTAVGALATVATGQRGSYCSRGPSTRFDVEAGATYRIAIDGVAVAAEADQGLFSLRLALLDPRPDNDFFSTPNVLAGNVAGYYHPTISTTTSGASRETGEPFHAGNQGGNSVWFAWTAPNANLAHIQVCAVEFADSPPNPFRSLLAVYSGSRLAELAPVVSASQNARVYAGNLCRSAIGSEVQFDPVAGAEYRIAVDGVSGTHGNLFLELWQRPPRMKTPPTTLIRRKRVKVSGRTASFSFHSNYPEASFECRMDRHPFAPCASGKSYGHLRTGMHLFEVRAVTALEGTDPTPARFGKFRIRRPRR